MEVFDIIKQQIKAIMWTALTVGLLLLGVAGAATAEPMVQEVSWDPEEPVPESTIEFNATVTSDGDISEIWLTVKECKTGLCFSDEHNVSMENIQGTSFYLAEVTLVHDDATYLSYFIDVKENDTWYQFHEFDNITLKIDTNGNTSVNGGSTNDDGNGSTPGFEIVFFLIAVTICVVILSRKRLR